MKFLAARRIPFIAGFRAPGPSLKSVPARPMRSCDSVSVILPESPGEGTLDILRRDQVSQNAGKIGTISAEKTGRVVLESVMGTSRVVEMLHGEQLPKIC